jgi:UDP-N-acetylglucosamine 3-dehydrogenase
MKIGIISFAHMHAFSYATHIVNHPNTELIAIWDESVNRGSEMANKFGCDYFSDMNDFLGTDIEAVIVCSENAKHKEHVIAAAKAKKHILCEKPIATTLEDAKEMIKTCEKEDVILEVAYPVRFSPSVMKARDLIQSGKIGDILAINSSNHGQMPGGWFVEKELSGGGAATDHIVHVMDLIRWIFETEVKNVYAELDTRFYNIDVEDCGIVSLELDSGAIVTIDPSWSRPKNFPTWGDVIMEVIGTKGTLKIDVFKQHIMNYNVSDNKVQHIPWGEDMDKGLINDFLATVANNTKPVISGVDGLRTLEVVIAAHRSNELKKVINVSKVV